MSREIFLIERRVNNHGMLPGDWKLVSSYFFLSRESAETWAKNHAWINKAVVIETRVVRFVEA